MDNAAKQRLEKVLEDFNSETRFLFQEGSQEPATINDLAELSRQVYYVISGIIKEL